MKIFLRNNIKGYAIIECGFDLNCKDPNSITFLCFGFTRDPIMLVTKISVSNINKLNQIRLVCSI